MLFRVAFFLIPECYKPHANQSYVIAFKFHNSKEAVINFEKYIIHYIFARQIIFLDFTDHKL